MKILKDFEGDYINFVGF